MLGTSFCLRKEYLYRTKKEEHKRIFLEEKNTINNKLKWAEDNDYSIPIIYYVSGIISNEALHLTGEEVDRNKERSCAYRLDDGAIRQMVRELF